MLVPLGVLALGAVFSGMIWYGSFFGKHEQVNAFFGIPNHHAEASHDDGHAAAGDDHASDDAGHGEDAGHGDDHAATHDDPAHKPVMAAHHGEAPQGAIFHHPDNHVLDEAHHAPKWVKVSPFVAMVLGLVVALWFYIWNPSMPAKVAESQRPLYLFLLNKWYFDEIYDFIFVRPAMANGRFFWKKGDGNVIDGTINGVAMGFIPWVTRLAGRAQSGYIFTYAFAMVIGVAVLITYMTLSGGAH